MPVISQPTSTPCADPLKRAVVFALLVRPIRQFGELRSCALALSLTGWTFTWAHVYAGMAVIPAWLTAAIFIAGIALIPFCGFERPASDSAERALGHGHETEPLVGTVRSDPPCRGR
jgi:hypothetical protein